MSLPTEKFSICGQCSASGTRYCGQCVRGEFFSILPEFLGGFAPPEIEADDEIDGIRPLGRDE